MSSEILHYIILILLFGSVFLVIKEFVYQRQELFLRLPEDETSKAQAKKTSKRDKVPMHKLLKTLAPLTVNLMRFVRQEQTKRAIMSSGSAMTVPEFLVFKILVALFACGSYVVIVSPPQPLFIAVSLLGGFMYPDFWLKGKIAKRHRAIRQDLPNVIDLLNLCVNAGVDFMLAVNKVIQEYKPCALRDELSELWRESQIGRSRRESLRALAWRVNLPEMTSFVRTLVQTDKMGAPMGEALRMQAEEIRVSRFQQGEAMAAKAPVKLLFPLLCFIMPVVMLIIAGPILLQFMKGGTGLNF